MIYNCFPQSQSVQCSAMRLLEHFIVIFPVDFSFHFSVYFSSLSLPFLIIDFYMICEIRASDNTQQITQSWESLSMNFQFWWKIRLYLILHHLLNLLLWFTDFKYNLIEFFFFSYLNFKWNKWEKMQAFNSFCLRPINAWYMYSSNPYSTHKMVTFA